jgi:hypothetical protein
VAASLVESRTNANTGKNRFPAWIDWVDRKASRSHRGISTTNSISIRETFSMFQSCHSAHK